MIARLHNGCSRFLAYDTSPAKHIDYYRYQIAFLVCTGLVYWRLISPFHDASCNPKAWMMFVHRSPPLSFRRRY